jgi:hypothetical protein
LYFTALQIGKFGPRIKIRHSDPSVDRNIRIVQQNQQVFKPYHMVFHGERGWGEQFPSQYFSKEKILKCCCGGAFICRFSLSMEVLKANPFEKRG